MTPQKHQIRQIAREEFNKNVGEEYRDHFSSNNPEPVQAINPFFLFFLGMGLSCIIVVIFFMVALITGVL